MARKTLRDDWDSFTLGDYTVINNPWNKWDLVNGVDYTQSVSFDTTDLTRDITFRWDWPTSNRVLAYPEIIVGYKPWSAEGTDVMSARVSDIRTLDLTHSLSIGGETRLFNVAYDLWLTDTPLGGETSITTEIMIWPHRGGPTDFGDDAVAGTYTKNGVTFDIFTYANMGDHSGGSDHTWRYVALVPRKDILKATIDVQDILFELVERGLISASDYVTGYELGAEVTGGKGRLDIDRISHTFDTNDADSGANRISGTSGRDFLYGLAGDDTLVGKKGDDLLAGGTGRDILTGGRGGDVFIFNSALGQPDTVTDFVSGKDTLRLDDRIFKALDRGDLEDGVFVAGRDFDSDTRLLYRRKSGELYYDADGAGSWHSARLVADFSDEAILRAADFEIV